MIKMVNIGIFGYTRHDPRLLRILRSGRYNLLWIIEPANVINDMEKSLQEQNVILKPFQLQLVVVNPRWTGEWKRIHGLLSPCSAEVVMRARPFGADCIEKPLSG